MTAQTYQYNYVPQFQSGNTNTTVQWSNNMNYSNVVSVPTPEAEMLKSKSVIRSWYSTLVAPGFYHEVTN